MPWPLYTVFNKNDFVIIGIFFKTLAHTLCIAEPGSYPNKLRKQFSFKPVIILVSIWIFFFHYKSSMTYSDITEASYFHTDFNTAVNAVQTMQSDALSI